MVRNRFDCPDWFVLFHFTIEPSHKERDWKISRLEKSATFFESCSLKLVVFFKWPESALKLPYWRESTIKLCRNFPESSLEMSLYKSFRLLYSIRKLSIFDDWLFPLSVSLLTSFLFLAEESSETKIKNFGCLGRPVFFFDAIQCSLLKISRLGHGFLITCLFKTEQL